MMLVLSFLLDHWLSVSLILVTLIYMYGTYTMGTLRQLGVNGPTPTPFLGSIMEVQKMEFFNFIHENTLKYGNIWGFYSGRKPTIVIADQKMLGEIFVKQFNNFMNRTDTVILSTNKGLFSVNDEEWKRIRKAITPAFTAHKIKLMVPLIHESCETLVKVCDEQITKSGSSIDVRNLFVKFATEVMLSSAFGVNAQTQSDPNDQYSILAKQFFQTNFIFLVVRLLFPFLLPVFSRFWPSASGKAIHSMWRLAGEAVEQKKRGECNRDDLVKLMLSVQTETEDGKTLSDLEIVSQCVTFLLTGTMSVSSTLTFTSYLLALNPDIQEKLVHEINEHFSGDAVPDYDTIQNMPYLEKVVSESLRFYPAGHVLQRVSKEACTLGDQRITKGLTVFVPVYSIHHDPQLWTNPEIFDPERFTPEAKASRLSYAYLPFGSGARNCIGQRFALLETKMALVIFLKKFKIGVRSETQIPIIVQGINNTLHPKGSVLLEVTRRY